MKPVIIVSIVLITCAILFAVFNSNNSTQTGANNEVQPGTDNKTQTEVPSDTTSQKEDTHFHAFGEWTITREATCTVDGEESCFCDCGERQVKSISATGHSFGDWTIVQAASCTTNGSQERVCACGEKLTQSISATGHSFGSWVTESSATCTKDGKNVRKCSTCGAKEETIRYATGHNWTSATCTTAKKCSTCGTTEGSALGHNYKNNSCTRCNAKLSANIIMPAVGGKYSSYSWNNKLVKSCEVTKIETPILSYGTTYTVKIALKSTYHEEGNNYSDSPVVGFKIYDENNIVVDSGTIFGENIKVGETCYKEFYIHNIEVGHTYRVEFNSVG